MRSRSDAFLEGSPRHPGGGGRLHRLVGHDARGQLLLGLLEAGAGGAVHGVHLTEQKALQTAAWGGAVTREGGRDEGRTFLNMTSDMTASAVNSAATRIMNTPAATLVFRHISAEIQPLRTDQNAFFSIKKP